MKRKKLGLSFRGGMARALSYIGVLKALEENDIKIDYVVASSMGAMIAAGYGFGLSLDEMKNMAVSLNLKNMFSLESLKDLAILGDDYVKNRFLEIFGDADFSAIKKFKLWVQVTDLGNRCSKLVEKGHLFEYLTASIAFPFLIKPVEIDGQLYIDGDVSGTFETKELRNNGADIVIAIDTGVGTQSNNHLSLLNRFLEPMVISMRRLKELDLEYNPCDIYLTDLGLDARFDSFEMAEELIESGYKKTMAIMPQLKLKLGIDH